MIWTPTLWTPERSRRRKARSRRGFLAMGWHPCCCEPGPCVQCDNGGYDEYDVEFTGILDSACEADDLNGIPFRVTYALTVPTGEHSPICIYKYHFPSPPCGLDSLSLWMELGTIDGTGDYVCFYFDVNLAGLTHVFALWNSFTFNQCDLTAFTVDQYDFYPGAPTTYWDGSAATGVVDYVP